MASEWYNRPRFNERFLLPLIYGISCCYIRVLLAVGMEMDKMARCQINQVHNPTSPLLIWSYLPQHFISILYNFKLERNPDNSYLALDVYNLRNICAQGVEGFICEIPMHFSQRWRYYCHYYSWLCSRLLARRLNDDLQRNVLWLIWCLFDSFLRRRHRCQGNLNINWPFHAYSNSSLIVYICCYWVH